MNPVILALIAMLTALAIALASADNLLRGHSWLVPYLYSACVVLLVFAAINALVISKHEQKETFAPSQPEHGQTPNNDTLAPTIDHGRPIFVLEVAGTPPLRSNNDWKFLLTNCGARTARYIKLSTIRSEIGAYEIWFKEIPALLAGQQIAVDYNVVSRRRNEWDKKISLWDFAMDHPSVGGRGTTYFWYDISIEYRDTDDSVRSGGVIGVCFDTSREILKTTFRD